MLWRRRGASHNVSSGEFVCAANPLTARSRTHPVAPDRGDPASVSGCRQIGSDGFGVYPRAGVLAACPAGTLWAAPTVVATAEVALPHISAKGWLLRGSAAAKVRVLPAGSRALCTRPGDYSGRAPGIGVGFLDNRFSHEEPVTSDPWRPAVSRHLLFSYRWYRRPMWPAPGQVGCAQRQLRRR
jgi:hypothetical protein